MNLSEREYDDQGVPISTPEELVNTIDGDELGRLLEETKDDDSGTVEVFKTPEGNYRFKLKMKPFSTYDHSKPPPKKKLLHGWMPHRRTAALLAQGGNLKSTLLVDQSIETAKQGKLAVIVSAEDESDDYYSKFWSALNTPESRHYGLDIAELSKFITVVDVSGKGYKLSAGPDRLGQRSEWVDHLIEDVRSLGTKVGFVAFETASRLCYGEENTDFAAAITITDYVAMTLNCSSVLSHHTAKFVAREKVVDNHAGRGGSALGDNTRSSITMTKLDRQYKGLRQPMCSPDEINEGKIIEMAHVRNSFGELMNPRYFRAKSGLGHAPIMEEIPSVRRGSAEERDWKREFGKEMAGDVASMIMEYVTYTEETGGDPISSGWIDDESNRSEHLAGASRKVAREAMKELVDSGKLVKVPGGRGRPTTYHTPDKAPVTAYEEPAEERELRDYNEPMITVTPFDDEPY